MAVLQNKIDFEVLFTVKNANPNGAQGVDPNAAAGADNGSDANNGGDNGNVYDADYKVEDDK